MDKRRSAKPGYISLSEGQKMHEDNNFQGYNSNRSDRAKKALGFIKRGYKFVFGKKAAFSASGSMICISSCKHFQEPLVCVGVCGYASFIAYICVCMCSVQVKTMYLLWGVTVRCFHEAWVAVHGPESICLVTWSQNVDVSRLPPTSRVNCSAERAMCSFSETVISDVECIPYDDAKDRNFHHFGHGVKLPFAVASVPKSCVREGPSFKYDFTKASKFLGDKMKSGLSSAIDETILTAISGFQHLCPKELNAEDIWVTVLTPSVGEMMHLHLNKRKEYLAVMKSGGSSPGLGVSSELAPPIVSASSLVGSTSQPTRAIPGEGVLL